MQGQELKHTPPSLIKETSLESTEAQDLASIHPNKCLSEDQSGFQNHPKARSRNGRSRAKRLLLQMLMTSALTQPAEAYTPHHPHTTSYAPVGDFSSPHRLSTVSDPYVIRDRGLVDHPEILTHAYLTQNPQAKRAYITSLNQVRVDHDIQSVSYHDAERFHLQRSKLMRMLRQMRSTLVSNVSERSEADPKDKNKLRGTALIKAQLSYVGEHMPSGVVLYDTAQNHKQRKAVKQYYEKKGLGERFEKELRAYRKASKR